MTFLNKTLEECYAIIQSKNFIQPNTTYTITEFCSFGKLFNYRVIIDSFRPDISTGDLGGVWLYNETHDSLAKVRFRLQGPFHPNIINARCHYDEDGKNIDWIELVNYAFPLATKGYVFGDYVRHAFRINQVKQFCIVKRFCTNMLNADVSTIICQYTTHKHTRLQVPAITAFVKEKYERARRGYKIETDMFGL